MPTKILVVGGVAAGASAAAKARRTDEAAEIIILEQGPFVSFANCGLPYYVGRVIPKREDLLITTPERFKDHFNIEVRLQQKALSIDPAGKQVVVKNLAAGEGYREKYDKLILATGSAPVLPPLEGSGLANIFHLWTIPDADSISALLAGLGARTAVIIGGGFVGLEALEALLARGLEVSLVEMLPQVLPAWDPEVAELVAGHLRDEGIQMILGDGVRRFLGSGILQQVELNSGRILQADLAVSAIGVRPRLELAREAGLKIGVTGGLEVNEKMQTSDPDIYAAGDIVQTRHLVSGRPVRLPLAGPANKQGRTAGANAAGGNMEFRGVLGSGIVRIGKLTVAKTGLNEQEVIDAGYQYDISYTYPLDHAGYYPGAKFMLIKLMADKETGRLLGAQAVGYQGVDKRIDVLATAMAAGFSVKDMENLELAYAPPYSSAKDPVSMAGMVASNILRGEVPTLTARDLRRELSNSADIQLVDVRTTEEFNQGYISGAVHLPLDHFRQDISRLDSRKKTVVYCRSGYRSYLALKILQQSGFREVFNLSGGYMNWSAAL
ncbi:FAD-dependent oxidoreductase [Pelotomaculum terephthalicicum JT]|uniref:FAD-dependent oxidoreductase n=1 Tax=Pelotomaculum TaxID=191373 RepID=UPI0009D21D91|nr:MULTISPECIES: FAD-dependent oxidoreductase [Pelotomaculum]MCG9968055.1 FAD-dependent oxidoreductase [Pelotomaculum terephthalicicum JT]OPX85647.1 MAG: Coenzyme A disulfide reductase [Pelotomaculum sp. PtaB.Bin117]OPY63981.1 MAG: Coenzyme A disulfide reductase [Pelotomaculum sp. PtaU1.Bin065]